MLIETDIMSEGRFKGWYLKDIPAPYMLWLYDNCIVGGEMWTYINENIDSIKEKAQKIKDKKMAKLQDTDLMPFGKYKGQAMQDVPADYLIWIYENKYAKGDVKEYIKENLDVLREEVKPK